jgi:hypothetical protein
MSALLGDLSPEGMRLAWARQVHSATVLTARDGHCGSGDALVTRERGLALVIGTADCVPVALLGADGESLAAVHAGWRGIAAGVVPRAVEALGAAPLAAWIGPAIGRCCYEVGEEVARAVVDAASPEVEIRDRGERPFLDLQRAVEVQLGAAGVQEIHRFEVCTRCHAEALWSYRRDGQTAGRNLLFAWLRS